MPVDILLMYAVTVVLVPNCSGTRGRLDFTVVGFCGKITGLLRMLLPAILGGRLTGKTAAFGAADPGSSPGPRAKRPSNIGPQKAKSLTFP